MKKKIFVNFAFIFCWNIKIKQVMYTDVIWDYGGALHKKES